MTFFSRLNSTDKKYVWLLIVFFLVLSVDLLYVLISYLVIGSGNKTAFLNNLYFSVITACIISGIWFYLLGKQPFTKRYYHELHAIIQTCPVPTIIVDNDDNIILINDEFQHTFGYDTHVLPNIETWWHKVCPNLHYRRLKVDKFKAYIEQVRKKTIQPAPLKVQITCADGTKKSVLISARFLGSAFQGLKVFVFYDATEQINIIHSLTQSKIILTSIIETIPLRLFWKDKNSTYLGCNTAFAQDAGKNTPAEVVGKQDDELIWRKQAAQYLADDKAVMETDKSILNYEESLALINGNVRILRTSKIPLHDTEGNTIGLLGIYDDITQQKKFEEDLWLAQTILDKCDTAFLRLDRQGAIQYANEFAIKRLERSLDEILGMHPWDFDIELLGNKWSVMWNILQTKGTIKFEAKHRHKNGDIKDILVISHNIMFHNKQFIFAIIQDITDQKRQERKLQQQEGYLRSLIDSLPFFVWLKNRDGQFLTVNKKVISSITNINHPEQLIGKTDFDIYPQEVAETYHHDDEIVMNTRKPKVVEEEIKNKHGTNWIESYTVPILDNTGKILGTVGYARDISARKKAEIELRIAATAFNSQEGMVVTDADNVILKVNPAFSRITGYRDDEALGQKMNILKSGVHKQDFYKKIWQQIRDEGSWQGEIWNRRKTGEIYPEWLTITAVKDENDQITHYVGNMIDITNRKEIEQQVLHLAHHDSLTNLPNRLLLTDRLRQAMAYARRKKIQLALIYLDLDNFKPVNDTLGHDVGDHLLCDVAGRLLTCVKRETDTVSRLGGDEFVILLPQIEDPKEAAMVAERILYALNQPFSVDDKMIEISPSIGIAVYPQHGKETVNLMKNADKAMYQAKTAGRNCYRFYQSNTEKL